MARLFLLRAYCAYLLLTSSLLHVSHANIARYPRRRCHEDERSTLLELKQTLNITHSCFDFQKLESWKLLDKELEDCCAWEGVSCDEHSSLVIGLDLSGTCVISGSMATGSSLLRLVHLQELNLACIDFHQSAAAITSTVANLSKLRVLNLSSCHLEGELPIAIFELPELEHLDVSNNKKLHGHLPHFNRSCSSPKTLRLSRTNFSGELPASLGNLSRSLSDFDISFCNFWGLIPCSLSNLTKLTSLNLGSNQFHGPMPCFSSLTLLTTLSLYGNNFTGEIPPLIGNLTRLTILDLGSNQLTGPIPHSIGNLTQFRILSLKSNKLKGPIPSQLGNLSHLEHLDLSSNRFSGSFPVALARLSNLRFLHLPTNNLNGTLRFDIFPLYFQSLSELNLSFNKLSVVFEPGSHNKFRFLGLASCNLSKFPQFLKGQDGLEFLDLSYNNISGRIPSWFLSVNSGSLQTLKLSGNSLIGFPRQPVLFNWNYLRFLDLSSNKLHGSLPIPPSSIQVYLVSDNRLSGEIPPSLCNLSTIRRLDLGKNYLTGVIPRCLTNLTSNRLSMLSLNHNNLHGTIPDRLDNNNRSYCSLRMMDVSDNQLHGPLPRSLLNCTKLEFLNVGNNIIVDTFPSWMGPLANLRVLFLRSNRFNGVIKEPEDECVMPRLQIIDISHNNFCGCLPSKYFQMCSATRVSSQDANYIGESIEALHYDYSMTINNKGMEMVYAKILNYFYAIDLSCNNFSGEIPEPIRTLVELRLLNMSHNKLTGHIHASLKYLKNLEALDLSGNMLSGEIPTQLTQLTSLSFFNVSYNRLSGPIPREKQFNTFENNSYIGNIGLCGDPLQKECGSSDQARRTSPSQEAEEGSYLELEWPIILMGLASGLVKGVVMGQVVPIDRKNWFVRKIFQVTN